MNCIDVIWVTENPAAQYNAILEILAIDDEDEAILSTEVNKEGQITKLDGWNPRWGVDTKAPQLPLREAELHSTRMTLHNFKKIIAANIEGFEILVAGYPSDGVETMLAGRILAFHNFTFGSDDDGTFSVATPVDLTVTDDEGNKLDHRIAPTEATCDKYRELYPEEVTRQDEEDNDYIETRGNFARHQ